MSNQENGPGIPHPSRDDDRAMLIAYLAQHARIYVDAIDEETPVRGNALASGDDVVDKECEDKILADWNSGNSWAWCSVTVTARIGTFEGTDHLGCCSYENEAQFRGDGYFDDMRNAAIIDLANTILADACPIPDPVAYEILKTARATPTPSQERA